MLQDNWRGGKAPILGKPATREVYTSPCGYGTITGFMPKNKVEFAIVFLPALTHTIISPGHSCQRDISFINFSIKMYLNQREDTPGSKISPDIQVLSEGCV